MKTWLPAALLAAALLLTAGCGAAPAEPAAVPEAAASEEPAAAYADGLLDPAIVHSIDIRVPDDGTWDSFIANCESKEYITCDLVIDGELVENAAIRGKGNSSMQRSRATGKYSFKVEFDHFTEGGSYRGLDKLALNNLVVDDSCLRDYITYRMMARFGVASPLCSFVFVTVNGEDWGFYLAVEGLEDAFLERNYGPEHGNLFKPDNLNNGGAREGMGRGDDVKLKYIDDDPDSYYNIFASAKTELSRRDQYRIIESLRKLNAGEDIPSVVDTEAMLRYLVVHTFVCNGDSYTGSSVHNYYLYEKDGRLTMLPWDYNEGFGDFGSSGMASVVNSPIDTPVTSGEMADRPMVAWVFSDEGFTARYHELYRMFLADAWDSGWLAAELTAARARIAPYVARDPRSFTTPEAFEAGVDQLLTFFDLRAQSVRGQLDGAIPATTAGQAADSSALVDTSALPSGRGSGGMGGGMPMPGASRESSGEASSSGEAGTTSDETETASAETTG